MTPFPHVQTAKREQTSTTYEEPRAYYVSTHTRTRDSNFFSSVMAVTRRTAIYAVREYIDTNNKIQHGLLYIYIFLRKDPIIKGQLHRVRAIRHRSELT